MLNRQAPIESQFFKRLHDNLNAEIALGTVSTIDEAIEWLTYTYYYTRAMKNPMVYGFPHKILDVLVSSLINKLLFVQDTTMRGLVVREHFRKLVEDAAIKLDQNEMIRYDAK